MRILILLIVLVLSQLSNGQISKTLSLGADCSKGNFSSVGLTVKAEIKKDSGQYTWSINPNYRWSEQSPYGSHDMNLYENELYNTANLSRQIGKWKVLLFTEEERSFQRKINFRGSVGIGLGHSIIKNKSVNFNISEVILPEYYSSSSNSSMNNFTVRSSIRIRFDYTKQIFKLSSVTLFQPAIYSDRQVSFHDNLNIRSTNLVSVNVNKRYSVGLLYTLSYQGYPYYINKAVRPLQETASIIVGLIF
jgi:hypothetical protein